MLTFARLAVTMLAICGLAGAGQAQGVPYVIDSKQLGSAFLLQHDPVERHRTVHQHVAARASIDDAAQQNTDGASGHRYAHPARPSPCTRASCAAPTSSMSPAIRRCSSRAAASARRRATTAEIIGDITVKGVTRPIVLHATLQPPGAGGAREFRAKTRINRNDFNMTAYALLVGDAVDIEIRALLRPAQ